MTDHALESRAFRRELLAGLVGLVVGFGVIQGGTICLLARYIAPDEGGWRAFALGVQALPLTLTATAGCFLAPAKLLQRWHYRRGVYRCFLCGRALRGTGSWCECRADEFRITPRRRRPMRHYRRRVKAVLFAYLAVVPLAIAFTSYAPGRGDMPFVVYALVTHALLCVLAGILVQLASAVLEMCNGGRRFRLRAQVFLRVFALWPLVFIIAAVVAKALGYE